MRVSAVVYIAALPGVLLIRADRVPRISSGEIC
jgi:hypothetical protein